MDSKNIIEENYSSYIVGFNKNISQKEVQQLADSLGIEILNQIAKDNTFLVKPTDKISTKELLNKLNSNNLIRYAEPNFTMDKSN